MYHRNRVKLSGDQRDGANFYDSEPWLPCFGRRHFCTESKVFKKSAQQLEQTVLLHINVTHKFSYYDNWYCCCFCCCYYYYYTLLEFWMTSSPDLPVSAGISTSVWMNDEFVEKETQNL